MSRELVLLYLSIGETIVVRQGAEGWGTKMIDRLAHDLQTEFPGAEGCHSERIEYNACSSNARRTYSGVIEGRSKAEYGLLNSSLNERRTTSVSWGI